MIKRVQNLFGSLRFRLIGWYLVLLLLTLVFFGIYLLFQVRQLEQAQQDTVIQTGLERARVLVDLGRPPDGVIRSGDPNRGSNPPNNDNNGRSNEYSRTGSVLYLRRNFGMDAIVSDLVRRNLQVRLLDKDGKVADSFGNSVSDMPTTTLSTTGGFATIDDDDKGHWRIYTEPVLSQGAVVAWLQVGQPVLTTDAQLGNLLWPFLLGALMILTLAVLGGLFLANQALRPIDRVTRTAQSITARDLSQRINYHGTEDEIGRLAKTLDQMLERLEHGFEQERRFTSDASHELRTPLTALKGRIEVTLSRPRSDKEYEQTLLDLNQEVERLVRLSNSLLYLARLDQTKYHWQFEALNLSDLLESIRDSLEPVAELKQITLVGAIPEGLEVSGNLDQLTRLFLNLVDNAIKYTPEGGSVTLSAEKCEKERKIRVAVADTGPGIDPAHLPHLFKRFYRVESDRASATGGAGLGLAIANEIARQHHGFLRVESEVGKGTEMSVDLPLPEKA